MDPKSIYRTLDNWLKAQQTSRHSLAVKYIEENVDLIDTDLQKFLDNCPNSCYMEVYEMLLKAGIDTKDCIFREGLKKFDSYIHDKDTYTWTTSFNPYNAYAQTIEPKTNPWLWQTISYFKEEDDEV